MIQTTYNLLRRARACAAGYRKFHKHIGDIGDDTPIDLHRACDSNSVQDILWALQNATLGPRPDKLLRELACDFAEHVSPIFEVQYPSDTRPRRIIEVACRYACDETPQNELERARKAATAATAATAARAAAYATTYAAAYATASYAAATEHTWQLSHLRAVLLKS